MGAGSLLIAPDAAERSPASEWARIASIWPGASAGAWMVPEQCPAMGAARVALGAGPRRGYGYDFAGQEAALARALGEAVERTVWVDRPPRPLPAAPPPSASGLELVLPAGLAWWPPGADEPTRPAAPEPGAVARWVRATGLASGTAAALPRQMVTPLGPGDALLWPVTSAGTAAHPSRERAVLSALVELIERDALLTAWLLDRPVPTLDLAESGERDLDDALRRCEAAAMRVRAALLPTDAPIHVVAAFVEPLGPSRAAGALGIAGSVSPRRAALRALAEALGLWHGTDSRLAAGFAAGDSPARLTAATRGLWWATPERWRDLVARLLGPKTALPDEPTGSDRIDDTAALAALAGWLRGSGYEAYVVDLLDPPLVRRLGYSVVRVVAPGLQPFYLAEPQRAVNLERLERAARLRGIAPGRLNPDPQPFP